MNDRRDLTSGNIVSKLIAFAIPIMGMSLLQAVYNIVDMIIVGQFVGSSGMSAVNIGGQVTHLVLCLCSGLSNGGSAYIGQLFGAGKIKDAKSVIGTLLSFLCTAALLFTAAVLFARHPLLRWLNTPAESYADTLSYLFICISGTLFIYVYNALSAALRGIGESMHPLIYVIITTVENIILDLLFVAVFDWGAAGAAAATVISQFTSMCLVIYYTKRHTDLFDFKPGSFRVYGAELRQLLKIGLPQAIQYTCTTISFLFIAALINSYGVSASAAAGAANKIWTFGTLPGSACMSAIVTMTAQNHPTGNFRRIMKGMFSGMAVSLSIAAVFFLLCQLAPRFMYSLFTSDESVSAVGIPYLRIYSISFFVETVMFCIYGVLTGSGYTTATMAGSIISAFGVRYMLALVLSRHTALGFNGIALAYSAAPFVGIFIGLYMFTSGRWKTSRIKIK